MQVSKHGKKRIKERCGVGKGKSERIVQLAYERGIKRNDTTGRLRKWLDEYYNASVYKKDIRVYGDKAYVFGNRGDEKVLVTVLQIPPDITKSMQRMKKKNDKRREDKKYE